MDFSQLADLRRLLGTYTEHLDHEIDRAEYDSPLYWRLVDRRAAAVAAYEATI